MSIFNSTFNKKPKLSAFDLSHERKMSMSFGDLVPCYLEEIVPGDQFQVKPEVFMRLAPMIAPIMHRVNAHIHFFFCPNRLVWNQWETFITGGRDGEDATAMPIMSINEANRSYFTKGSLADYMGLPITDGTTTLINTWRINAMPFRVYQTIYNEWYRDQNLIAPITFNLNNSIGSDYPALCTMRQRAWAKDYFTSALPWTQRGGESVIDPYELDWRSPALAMSESGNALTGALTAENGGIVIGTTGAQIRNINTSSSTVETLRRAVRLQEWLEKQARGGARYIETIKSHFGVKVPDYRLQRPEFLGGSVQPVTISEVLSTFENAEVAQGQMAGHGISVGSQFGFKQRFQEHGYVMGIISLVPTRAYQQGIDRIWIKEDKFDFYWPSFAQTGEQEVFNKELYAAYEATPDTQNDVFGYQSRYAEYKYHKSSVHGDFRDSLAYWHMGSIFSAEPALNQTFIEVDKATPNRVFNVIDTNNHKVYVQMYLNVKALRPIPFANIPTI